jgi:hypothetical protein
VFLKLFAADPSWMGEPGTFLLLNFDTGMMTEGTWPISDAIAQQSLESELLFIYSDWTAGTNRFGSSVTLAETTGRAVYTLSFPTSVLQQETINDLEQRFLHIYEVAASIENCSVLVGPELEIQPTRSAKEAIASALSLTSLAAWIIAPEEYLPGDVRPFEVITKDKGALFLRHPDAARQLM